MPRRTGGIYALAGTNGAGKSSIGGAVFRQRGADYFDPHEATARILAVNPGLSMDEANSAAWPAGKRLLEVAIRSRLRFAIETTLGGSTIPALLAKAATEGLAVRMCVRGPFQPRSARRARARASRSRRSRARGDDPRRYDDSRLHLIDLLPFLTELYLYDNSIEADPAAGKTPSPVLVLHWKKGRVVGPRDLSHTPDWAKPIVAAACKAGTKR